VIVPASTNKSFCFFFQKEAFLLFFFEKKNQKISFVLVPATLERDRLIDPYPTTFSASLRGAVVVYAPPFPVQEPHAPP
jgi:hypothetical protein